MSTDTQYSLRSSPADSGVDPYTLWGLATDFADFVGASSNVEPRLFRVILELETHLTTEAPSRIKDQIVVHAVQGDEGMVRVSPVYETGPFRFLTASVPRSILKALSEGKLSGVVHRFALTTALSDPASMHLQNIIEAKGGKPLSGKIAAVIDTGCPFLHHAFLDDNKQSRVKYLWNQSRKPPALETPEAYWAAVGSVQGSGGTNSSAILYGSELSEGAIKQIAKLGEADAYKAIGYSVLDADWTHGGAVMGLAAGRVDDRGAMTDDYVTHLPTDHASQVPIIFVQLPQPTAADAAGLSMAGYVLDALHYIRSRTTADAKIAVVLSFGRHAGPHDGSSMIECAIDDFKRNCGRNIFVSVAAGNANLLAGHAKIDLEDTKDTPVDLVWRIPSDVPVASLVELWFNSADISLELIPPGSGRDPIKVGSGRLSTLTERGQIIATAVYSTKVGGFNNKPKDCVLIAVAPTVSVTDDRVEAPYGNWTIRLKNNDQGPVTVHAWIERAEELVGAGWGTRQSSFAIDDTEDPNDEYAEGSRVTKFTTLNGIATGEGVDRVGAAFGDNSLTPYSSAGPMIDSTPGVQSIKHLEISDESREFPGVAVIATYGVGMWRMNGTSAAAPKAARGWLNGMYPLASLPTDDSLTAARGGVAPP